MRLAIALLAAALLASACGSDDDSSSASGTAPEATEASTGGDATPVVSAADAAFLEQVTGLLAPLQQSFESIDDTLNQTWPVRSRLIEVLTAVERAELVSGLLDSARELTPSAAYAEDYAALVRTLEEALPHSQAQDAALANDDLVTLVVEEAAISLVVAAFFHDISTPFCVAVTGDDFVAQAQCNSNDLELPHGEYGAELFDSWRRYQREFGPRAGAFVPAMAPEERFESLRILQPAIVSSLDVVIDEVGALDPPAELTGDHERLLVYLEDTRQTAMEINAAVNEGDTVGVLQLFEHSITVFCDAADDLTTEIAPLVGFFFPPGCDAPPPGEAPPGAAQSAPAS
jgi:hypothetical protein